MQHVQSNIQKKICRVGNIQECTHLQNQNYLVQNVVQNKKNGHKSPNNSHRYYDEMKLFKGISKRNKNDNRH